MFLIIKKKTLFKFGLVIIIAITSIMGIGLFLTKGLTYEAPNPEVLGYVSLIIDDFGNHGEGTEAFLKLSIPITAAIIPALPSSQIDAEAAHNAGLEVIMHVPMQPLQGNPGWLGPQGITNNLSDQEIQSRINDGLAEIKWAVGMNNHMGSKTIQDKRIMNAILQIAKQKNLFFIDSLTSPKSVATEVAQTLAIPHYARDVFLDNSKNKADIEKQLDKLTDIALKKGYAIGIGHVGPEGGTVTAEAIASRYPLMQENGIRFINVSEFEKIKVNCLPK